MGRNIEITNILGAVTSVKRIEIEQSFPLEEEELFPSERREYNFCANCGNRLTKDYLCPKCDLGIGISDPDYEDDLY